MVVPFSRTILDYKNILLENETIRILLLCHQAGDEKYYTISLGDGDTDLAIEEELLLDEAFSQQEGEELFKDAVVWAKSEQLTDILHMESASAFYTNIIDSFHNSVLDEYRTKQETASTLAESELESLPNYGMF